jgi:hypothetical protein
MNNWNDDLNGGMAGFGYPGKDTPLGALAGNGGGHQGGGDSVICVIVILVLFFIPFAVWSYYNEKKMDACVARNWTPQDDKDWIRDACELGFLK